MQNMWGKKDQMKAKFTKKNKMINTTNATNTTNNLNKKNMIFMTGFTRFIIQVIKIINSLPKNQSNFVITSQILRSVTSMGANDQEADGTLTKKDFLHTYTIVRKEAKETNFWLRLITGIQILTP